MLLLAVAVGGALGALARYALSGGMHAWLGTGFPWGTLVVNVLGSFLLGLLFRLLTVTTATPELRAFVAVGVLGAFTTFSTFAFETLTLLEQGSWGRGGAYLLGSVLLGLIGVAAGLGLATALLQPRG